MAEHSEFMSDKHVFKGRVQQYNGEASMQQALMKAGPIEVAFTVYEDFEVYTGGIYKATSSKQMGGHAVKLVGWGVDNGVKYWKIANSWNPYWGENGYFRIVRGTNECGIESQTAGNDPSEGWCKVQSKSCAGQAAGSACATCDGEVFGECDKGGKCCSMDQLCGDKCLGDGETCCSGQAVVFDNIFQRCCDPDGSCRGFPRSKDPTCCGGRCCGAFDACNTATNTCARHFAELV